MKADALTKVKDKNKAEFEKNKKNKSILSTKTEKQSSEDRTREILGKKRENNGRNESKKKSRDRKKNKKSIIENSAKGFLLNNKLKRIALMTLAVLGFFAISLYFYKKGGEEANWGRGLNKNIVAEAEDEPIEAIDQLQIDKKRTNREERRQRRKKVERFNTDKWLVYKNALYGFQLKYPSDWDKPINIKGTNTDKWAQKFVFRKKQEKLVQVDNSVENGSDSQKEGFNIVVYPRESISELFETEELALKVRQSFIDEYQLQVLNSEVRSQKDALFLPQKNKGSHCKTNSLRGHFRDLSQFEADEISIPLEDECFESTLLFTITREEYVYNIVPILKEDLTVDENNLETKSVSQLTKEILPEFFTIAKEFELIEIVIPEPVVKQEPKNNKIEARKKAPMPVSYKKVDGKLVCAKKNDKPRKSKKNNKGKIHMDMECCLDPDEIPNPHCTYEAKRYQKFLKNPPKKDDDD